MSEEDAFLAGIRAEPKDDLRRLVYADWLDERGDDESRTKAEYLRLVVHLAELSEEHPERNWHTLCLRQLALKLPLVWKTRVTKAPVENCGVLWRFQCPKKWDQMSPTEDEKVRFCTACRRTVHYYDSIEEARWQAENHGQCVVIDLGVLRRHKDMDLLRGPPELDSTITGLIALPEDFNYDGRAEWTESITQPSFFRRVWRKLTGQ